MNRRGYTLVEVVVAMLLVAVMVSSVFSVALTAKHGGGRTERKLIAARASKHVTAVLRTYAADPDAPVNAATASWGPGGGASKWSMTDSVVTDSCGNCYALSPGTHTLTGVLPTWFAAAPYNATLKYYVNNALSVSNGTPVGVTVDWQEPTP